MYEEAEKAWKNYKPANYPTLVGAGPAECNLIQKSAFIYGFEAGRMLGAIPPAPRDLPIPIPMQLDCPRCHARHIDAGEFANLPHSTHACQNCGLVWKPAKVNTVGVEFLPGYKN